MGAVIPFKRVDRPAAKSSTGVLVSAARGGVACQVCGCRPTATILNAVTHKAGCTCKCHS
jgi:hypothetical protein